jgi:formate hydrogenlyase transcriptional activator
MCPLTAPNFELDLQRYAALLEMTDVVSRHREAGELFRDLTPHLRAVVPFDFLNFALYDSTRKVVRMYLWEGAEWPLVPREVAVEDSVAAWVWRNQATVSIADVETETQFEEGVRWLREFGLRSYCALPMTSGQVRVGALGFGSRRPAAFEPHDVRFLHRISELVALSIENALNQAALAEESDRAHTLLEVEATLTASHDLKHLLPATARGIRRLVPHDAASISYFDESAGALRQYALDPSLGYGGEGFPIRLDDSIAGRTFRTQEVLVLEYPDLVGLELEEVRKQLDEGIRSACSMPLKTSKGPVGVLWLGSKSDGGFAGNHLSVLHQLAPLVALALESALVHRSLRQQRERMQVLLGVSTALASNWNVQQVFPKISACLRRVLRQEYANIALLDEKAGTLARQVTDFPLGKGLLTDFDVGGGMPESPAGTALAARSAMTFGRNDLAGYATDFAAKLLQEGIKSMCCVPLGTSRGLHGTLNLGSTREDAFKPEDMTLLRQVAGQIAIAIENARAAQQIEELKNRLAEEKRYLEGEIRTELNFEEIVGESVALKKVLDAVGTVANTDATVLVLGETGTGKELVARAIHRLSRRKDRGFIKVNCAAIPTGLLESELFGHEKGAFTGAISQKIGRIELADQGTLFLDEVGEISTELQPKLLRVLQDQEFERLGGNRTIKVNVRLIAATNRDLSRSVAQREFRSDLFYRLNVFPIRMPPLRDRREDIPMLVRYFVHKYARRMDRRIETISSETMNALSRWHWPGNVRELENFIERSVIVSEGSALRVPLAELVIEGASPLDPADHSLDSAEREHIIKVLRETAGQISGPAGAARRLGLKRTTLQSKMQRLKITREDYLSPK